MNNITKLTNFLKYLSLHGVSQKSLKFYKSDIKNFLIWAKDRKLNNQLIREYINSQILITPHSTINRRLSTLRAYSQFIGDSFMNGVENVSKNINGQSANTGIVNVPRSSSYRFIQEAILNRFKSKPRIQSIASKIFFNRPNWYRRYHSYPLANYLHIAILVIFSSLSAYALYDQVFRQAGNASAFPTALTRPNRYLSFQGRLTNNLGNPITTATNVVFKLYTASSGGSELWTSGTCSITPDSDGIFSTLLGSSCGSEIASSVFSENASVWVGVTVGADAEATPRIQIATVGYALNSETLQGYPAGTGTSTIPYINSSGEVVIAAASPKLQSTSGTFSVEGVALTITTPNTSNGVITVNPDGTGTLNLTFEGAAAGGSANGFVNATNANITSGALYGGTVASAATGYNFIDFQSGVSPTSKFSVQDDGDIVTSGDLTLSGGNLNTGNIALTVGDATTDSVTVTTDGTGNGEVILPNDSVGPNEVFTTGQTDEYCLTYEATSTTWEWQSCGGSSVWSSLTAPTTDLTLSMAGYYTTFNWDAGADTALTSLSLSAQGEDTTGSGDEDQVLLALSQATNGASNVDEGLDALLTLTNSDGNDEVQNAIRFDTGGAGTDFTYGINFDAADIGTAELKFENSEQIHNQTDGTITIEDGSGTDYATFSSTTLTALGNLVVQGTTGITFSTGVGGDITFANGEKIDNDTDGTVAITATTTALSGNLSLSGGTISDSTDEVDINDALAVSSFLQVGGTSATTYSRFGTGTAGHGLSTTDDLLIGSDLEIDGNLYLDSGIVANSAGTSTILLSSTPTTSANTLSAGNWMVDNTANVGQAALIVNQQKGGDLFTASASGTPKFTISNTGVITLANGETIDNSTDAQILLTATTTKTSANLEVAGTTGLTFSGVGGDITFTNGEKIDNDTDGTVAITAPTTSLSGVLTVNGTSGNGIDITNTGITTDIVLQNDETIDNNTNGTITLTSTYTALSGILTGTTGTNLRLQSTGTTTGNTGDSSIYFLNSSGTTKGRYDTGVGRFGDGGDGSITITSDRNCQTATDELATVDLNDTQPDCIATALTGTANIAGVTSITVSSITGFVTGDQAIVIQMTGTNAGNYDIIDITGTSGNTISFGQPLQKSYESSGAQVVRIPQYTNVTLSNANTDFTVSAWNGTVGGVLYIKATGTVSVAASTSINTNGLGGGGGSAGTAGTNGTQSTCTGTDTGTGGAGGDGGTGGTGTGPGGGGGGNGDNNGTGGVGGGATGEGGGGGGSGGGGAGGSYASASSAGTSGSAGGDGGSANNNGLSGNGGSAGTALGDNLLSTLYMGSGGGGGQGGGGGGGGGCQTNLSNATGGAGATGAAGGAGGAGGGIVVIAGTTVTNSGTISSNGVAGSDGSNANNGSAGTGSGGAYAGGGGGGSGSGGGGGGGSGGSAWIITSGTLPTAPTVTAGSGGNGGATGGNGGGCARNTGTAGGGGGGGARTTAGTGGSTGCNSSGSSGTTTNSGSGSAGSAGRTISSSTVDYGTLYAGAVNTGSADIAENYVAGEAGIEPGDVVIIAPGTENIVHDSDGSVTKITEPSVLYKANRTNHPSLFGVVSTEPGIVLGSKETADGSLKAVALTGRVPVKIDPNSDPIMVGDYLTSSEMPGYARKSTSEGLVIGKALESWQPGKTGGRIMVFVNLSWYDPRLTLNSEGELKIESSEDEQYVVTDSGNTILKDIAGFASVVAAKIRVGLIESKVVKTHIISPIADTDLIIDLTPEQSLAQKLIIRGVDDKEVVTIDASGSANFAGDVKVNELAVTNDATISGTLYADKIESNRLTEIEELLKSVEENQSLLADSKNWATDTSTNSGVLNANILQTTDLYATGQVAISSLFVSDNFTTRNINSLDGPLSIQSLAYAPIEIMGGKIKIDTSGNAYFEGNVEIAGDLTIQNLIVANNDPVATESGSIDTSIINTNATAGKAILPANADSITINNSKVSNSTLVYITPLSSTQNRVLYVKSKGEGFFTVGFSESLDSSVEFNWWIIDLQNNAGVNKLTP